MITGPKPLLEIEDVSVEYGSGTRATRALDSVSLTIGAAQAVGLVGESGSGKSTLARTLIGTLAVHGARASAGRIRFDGLDLLALDGVARRRVQGRRIGYVPQDALGSLNPVMRVGTQIAECFRVHERCSRRAARERAIELIDRVGIPDPRRRARDYPHQLSGGMRQRVCIAIAIAMRPDLLVADEPTTALDATIQAQIIELLAELRRETGIATLLVSHDLGVVAELAEEVVVLYAGRVVERVSTAAFFTHMRHPYSKGLLDASPRMLSGEPLRPIPGTPPSLSDLPSGCAFHPRCPLAETRCAQEVPRLVAHGNGTVACHLVPVVDVDV